jgi:type IV pilus assembly protein PilB
MNMGIEPFLVATSVHLVAAQRLVRKVCQFCKEPDDIPLAALLEIGFREEQIPALNLFKGRGCERCSNTGFKGRIALYEVMDIDDEIREMILSGASSVELRERAISHDMITLRQSGLRKIADGVTTVEEVVRETVV